MRASWLPVRTAAALAVLGSVLAGCGSSGAGRPPGPASPPAVTPSSGPSTSPTSPTSSVSPTGPASPVSPTGPASPVSPASPRGTVQGQVVHPPGQDPRAGGGGGGGYVGVNGDQVTARDRQGKTVATAVTVPPDGRFELGLPPGSYRVVEATCGVGQDVEVTAGSTTSVLLVVGTAC